MNELNDPWYTIQDIDQLDSPAFVVYPARVDHNIRLLTSMIDNPQRLRPHVKSHKAGEPTKMMLAAGIKKFKCATIAEAEMLAINGAPDVLLAYQPGGPKLKRFLCLVQKYPAVTFACLIDNKLSADAISAAFKEAQLVLPVYLDVNAGMNRTGIIPDDKALDLYRYAVTLPGIRPVGLHAYDGHIHDHNLQTRTQQADAAFALTSNLQAAIESAGYPKPLVIIGGSPSLPIHARRPEVECSPGTFVYWDKGYLDAFDEQPFHPAALVITRVVSMPDTTRICLDLGHKSIAPESELGKRVYFLNAPGLLFVSQSEEHLVMDAGAGHAYKIGDVLYGMPYHVCPTVALYERSITINEGLISGEWKHVARDRTIGC